MLEFGDNTLLHYKDGGLLCNRDGKKEENEWVPLDAVERSKINDLKMLHYEKEFLMQWVVRIISMLESDKNHMDGRDVSLSMRFKLSSLVPNHCPRECQPNFVREYGMKKDMQKWHKEGRLIIKKFRTPIQQTFEIWLHGFD